MASCGGSTTYFGRSPSSVGGGEEEEEEEEEEKEEEEEEEEEKEEETGRSRASIRRSLTFPWRCSVYECCSHTQSRQSGSGKMVGSNPPTPHPTPLGDGGCVLTVQVRTKLCPGLRVSRWHPVPAPEHRRPRRPVRSGPAHRPEGGGGALRPVRGLHAPHHLQGEFKTSIA